MNLLSELRKIISEEKNPERAVLLSKYFKTGKGHYGEGDIFIGLSVPQCREIAKKYSEAGLETVEALLNSKIHEERLIGLLILVKKFERAKDEGRKEVYTFYLGHSYAINNWDLVDLSASRIVGAYLIDKKRDVLFKLAKSSNLWERRIAIVSTFAFIAKRDFEDSLKLSETLLSDKHDLIHKAVGWALREIGKKDLAILESFLKKHYSQIPRTTLRYAIERFPEEKRKRWLRGIV